MNQEIMKPESCCRHTPTEDLLTEEKDKEGAGANGQDAEMILAEEKIQYGLSPPPSPRQKKQRCILQRD